MIRLANPTNLVCVLFGTAILTSSFNFIQFFIFVTVSFFLLPSGQFMSFSNTTWHAVCLFNPQLHCQWLKLHPSFCPIHLYLVLSQYVYEITLCFCVSECKLIVCWELLKVKSSFIVLAYIRSDSWQHKKVCLVPYSQKISWQLNLAVWPKISISKFW